MALFLLPAKPCTQCISLPLQIQAKGTQISFALIVPLSSGNSPINWKEVCSERQGEPWDTHWIWPRVTGGAGAAADRAKGRAVPHPWGCSARGHRGHHSCHSHAASSCSTSWVSWTSLALLQLLQHFLFQPTLQHPRPHQRDRAGETGQAWVGKETPGMNLEWG